MQINRVAAIGRISSGRPHPFREQPSASPRDRARARRRRGSPFASRAAVTGRWCSTSVRSRRLNETGDLHRPGARSSVPAAQSPPASLPPTGGRSVPPRRHRRRCFDEQSSRPYVRWPSHVSKTGRRSCSERCSRKRRQAPRPAGGLSQAPLRSHRPAADPVTSGVRLQRDQPAVRCALALLESRPVGLPCR